VLQQSDLAVLFSNDADFSGLTNGDQSTLRISKVFHKTFVEVNEKGAEAAAATAIIAVDTSVPQDPTLMQLNRPFLFAIQDRQSKMILFMGHVVNPAL
jgi:serpin B